MVEWVKKLKAKGVSIDSDTPSRTQLINLIGEIIEPGKQEHPVLVTDYFTELCPLAKKNPKNPNLSERFELYMGGMELANGYSELNDPIEQAERFREEIKGRQGKESELYDADYVRALEHGMPPAGGLGIGIDRLVMLLTNQPSIREVILFPQLRTGV
jgi:lysyl-tRNA synthetase, class II